MSYTTDNSKCECKVGRKAEAYSLDDLNTELETRYVAEDASLRDIADYINTCIIESRLRDVDADITGDPASIYTALISDDVSAERRATIHDQLVFANINIDQLNSDFVSHQTARAHLRECMDVDTSRSGVDNRDDALDLIKWARERDSEIIERVVQRLRRIDELHLGNYDVSHSVRITCYDCVNSYRPKELLGRGRCECSSFDNEPEKNSQNNN